ncbi:MAG: MFS transporter, partial [Pontiellaceae bacterium]|nr:MFS transporter [Pontiellaceae bacterium]
VSEVNKVRTGALKDGSYAAVFSFVMKMTQSVGLFITGYLLDFAGIISGADEQTVEAAQNISVMTFLSGPIVIVFAILVLRKYPVDRAFMESLREAQPDVD